MAAPRMIDLEGLRTRGIKHSIQQICRWMAAKQFPKAVMLGRKRAWVETEIDDWIKARIDARNKEPAAA
jgi:prophage regulatory protein